MLKESEKFIKRLQNELEKVGLNFIAEQKDYRTDKWIFMCPWKNEDKIEILWHKTYTEDINEELDDFAEFVVNDIVLGIIETGDLLNQKLDQSIYNIIRDQFKMIAENYTGKNK